MSNDNLAPLTKEELKDCETFEQIRISYHMTQEQWAKAIGISYGLVKRIESRTIKCSSKTKVKVRNFIDQFNANQESPDLHGLEAHILYDVLLSHMEQIPKKDASVWSARCTKAFQNILSYASALESADAQKIYFQFLEQLLTMLSYATADAVEDIKQGEDILNINHGLKAIFNGKQITRFKNSADIMVSKGGEITYQNSLFDLGF